MLHKRTLAQQIEYALDDLQGQLKADAERAVQDFTLSIGSYLAENPGATLSAADLASLFPDEILGEE